MNVCETSVNADSFLIAYGSALILPLSVVEGPIVSVATGFLSSQGYFAWPLAITLLVCGDLVGDLIYYWIGRSGVTTFSGLGRRFGPRAAVSPELQCRLKHHSTKMLLIGKWTHSIGCLVLVGSGMLRLPLPQFLLVNLLATLPKSGALFAFGYFAGNHTSFLHDHFFAGSAVLAAAGLVSIAVILRQTRNFGVRP
jgi:membrane protein DedA with SNARE-associated domain